MDQYSPQTLSAAPGHLLWRRVVKGADARGRAVTARVAGTLRSLLSVRFVALAAARRLRGSGITALQGALEPLYRREMVIDILDLTDGHALEPRDLRWGRRRQCPAVGPHSTPAERTTSRFFLISQSPSKLSHEARDKPPLTSSIEAGSCRPGRERQRKDDVLSAFPASCQGGDSRSWGMAGVPKRHPPTVLIWDVSRIEGCRRCLVSRTLRYRTSPGSTHIGPDLRQESPEKTAARDRLIATTTATVPLFKECDDAT
jgi:hypothetical protein